MASIKDWGHSMAFHLVELWLSCNRTSCDRPIGSVAGDYHEANVAWFCLHLTAHAWPTYYLVQREMVSAKRLLTCGYQMDIACDSNTYVKNKSRWRYQGCLLPNIFYSWVWLVFTVVSYPWTPCDVCTTWTAVSWYCRVPMNAAVITVKKNYTYTSNSIERGYKN